MPTMRLPLLLPPPPSLTMPWPCAPSLPPLQGDAEAMRQSAYEELWKAEDDIRALNADLAQRATKVGVEVWGVWKCGGTRGWIDRASHSPMPG